MKGINLLVSSVIILAILSLVFLGYIFSTGPIPPPSTRYRSAINNGCKIYLQSNQSVESIMVGDINNDGKQDNLLTACKLYYSNESMEAEGCEQICRAISSSSKS